METSSAAPAASASGAPVSIPVSTAALPLLLDTRAPELPAEVDPLVATIEALPPKLACGTFAARGRKLGKLSKRTADAYAQCKAELEKGGAELRGCLMLSELLHELPRDEVLSDNIATRACARGNKRACVMMAESRLGSGARFDPICAEQMLEALCAEGEPTACFRLGSLELEGVQVPGDVATAKRRIQEACDAGAYLACLDIANREELGDAEEKKLEDKAFAFANKACTNEDAAACLDVAWAYKHSSPWSDSAASEDERKYLEHARRACTLGSLVACGVLGRSERTDRYKDLCEDEIEACAAGANFDQGGIAEHHVQRCAAGANAYCGDSLRTALRRAPPSKFKPAPDRAARLEAGCLEGAAGACAIVTDGKIVQAIASEKVLVMGCDLAVAASCVKLAERAEAAGDRTTQLRFLERGCPVATPQGGLSISAAACRLAGLMYRDGVGVEKDLDRAAMLLQKGCLQNRIVWDGEACAALGTMYEEGTGVPKDLSRAVDLYAAGCEGQVYQSSLRSRAVSRSNRGGPPPPPEPTQSGPTACERFRKYVPQDPAKMGRPR